MNITSNQKEAFQRKLIDVISSVSVSPAKSEDGPALFSKVSWRFPRSFDQQLRELPIVLGKDNQNIFLNLFGSSGPIDIVFSNISSSLSGKPWAHGVSESVNLSSFLSYEETKSLAQKISDDILSYPHKYRLFLQIPGISDFDTNINLSSESSLVLSSAAHAQAYSISENDIEDVLYPAPSDINSFIEQWKGNSVYLSIDIEGYHSIFASPNFTVICEDKLFSILGLSLATNMLSRAYFTHDYYSKSFSITDTEYMPTFDLSTENRPKFVGFLQLPALAIEVIKLLVAGQGFNNQLEIVKNVLQPPINNEAPEDTTKEIAAASKSILGASRWYFDSISEKNGTHSFIHAMVGLEIILGDKKRTGGLTDKLSDRIAYLLARSMADRRTIRRKFATLYSLRSKIIHTGSVLLPHQEQNNLRSAQHYLKSVIASEAERFFRHVAPGIS